MADLIIIYKLCLQIALRSVIIGAVRGPPRRNPGCISGTARRRSKNKIRRGEAVHRCRGRLGGWLRGASGALFIRLFFHNSSQPKTLCQTPLPAANFFARSKCAPSIANLISNPIRTQHSARLISPKSGLTTSIPRGTIRIAAGAPLGTARDARGTRGGRSGVFRGTNGGRFPHDLLL